MHRPAWIIAGPKHPVEPRKGVLVDSVFRYQEHNSSTVGQEDFGIGIDIADASFGGAVLAVTLKLTAQGEPTLVFVKDRRNSVRWAYRLAECVNLPPAQQAIEQLSALPPTSTRRRRATARQNRISRLAGLHKIRQMWYTKSSGGRKGGCRSCV